MSTADQVPESSMEEILASIRKIISEGESPGERAELGGQAAAPAPPDNVSRLFGATPAASSVAQRRDPEPPPSVGLQPSGDAAAASRHPLSRPADAVTVRPSGAEVSRTPESRTEELRRGPALPPHDVAAEGTDDRQEDDGRIGARSVEQVAEDLLRAMLRDWLNKNLPALVERLVREEIARVIRNRTDV